MNDIEITIRSIQHFMYCPHRWGMLEIDRAWAENVFVTKANLLHERVHNSDRAYTLKGRKVYTAVPMYNDLDCYNLYGVVDCIELTKSSNGVEVAQEDNQKYNFCIVEYKPTKPKSKEYNEEDLMQVFAQKLCVDYVFGCDSSAVIYYADVKKRVSLPLNENYNLYDIQIRSMLTEMRKNIREGIIPNIKVGQNCNGCSMKNVCMPSRKKTYNLLKEIKKLEKAEL